MEARSEELLRAIATHPDDNAPRLAFAQHVAGDLPAHAALIVAQCAGNDDRTFVAAFLDELPELLRDRIEPVRGFADRDAWHFEERDFVELDPDVLFRVAPACTRLTLQDVSDFAACGARLARFDTLQITSTLFDNATGRRFAAASGFAHLTALAFDPRHLDDETLAAIYDRLPALERVKDRPPMRLLEILRRAPCAPALRTLSLEGDVDLRGFTGLRDLDVMRGTFDTDFAELPNRFHELVFMGCTFTRGLCAAINESRTFSKLRTLELQFSGPRAFGIALLASPACGPIRKLALCDRDVDDPVPLVQAVGNLVGSLEDLELDLAMTDDAFQILATTPFAHLHWLAITTPLTPAAARSLAAAPWIHGLRGLTFDVSRLDDASAVALAGALAPACHKMLHGESYAEVFDAFGVYSEDV